jgi:hypothetical protein
VSKYGPGEMWNKEKKMAMDEKIKKFEVLMET